MAIDDDDEHDRTVKRDRLDPPITDVVAPVERRVKRQAALTVREDVSAPPVPDEDALVVQHYSGAGAVEGTEHTVRRQLDLITQPEGRTAPHQAHSPTDVTPSEGTEQTVKRPVLQPGERPATRARITGAEPGFGFEPTVQRPTQPPPPQDPGVIESTSVRSITSDVDPLIGAMLGEYRVLAPLGEGGVGLVYRGEQPVIGRPVAIKVLKREYAQDPNHTRRFLEEARSVSAARHPGIIDVFSFGQTASGEPYLVMELLEGEPLDVLLKRRGALPVREALGLAIPVLNALSAAHAAGVTHRDLKPGNVFVVKLRDGTTFPKLLDFGLARRGEANAMVRQTSVGGTPLYIAPEQVRGEPVGPQTDLYSFGCVLFELLAGRPPFTAVNLHALLDQHLKLAPPSLRARAPLVSEELERLVYQLLEKDLQKRPVSALEVRDELERLSDALPRRSREEEELSAARRSPLRGPGDEEVSASRRSARSGDEEVSSSRRSPLRGPGDEEVSASRRVTPKKSSSSARLKKVEPEVRPTAQNEVLVPAPAKWPWVLVGLVVLGVVAAIALWPREAPVVPVITRPTPIPVPVPVAKPEPELVPQPEPVVETPQPEPEPEPEPTPTPVKRPKVLHRPAEVKQRWRQLKQRAKGLPDDLRRAAMLQLDEASYCTGNTEACWRELTEIEQTFFKK